MNKARAFNPFLCVRTDILKAYLGSFGIPASNVLEAITAQLTGCKRIWTASV